MIAQSCGRCLLAAMLLTGTVSTGRADPQWAAFRSPEHGFAASFPATPRTSVDGKPGDAVVVFKFEASDTTGQLFVVLVYEFGKGVALPQPTEAGLDKVLRLYGSGSKTQPRNEHMTKIAGHPAIEAAMEDPTGNEYELVDISVASRRMYVIISSGPKGHDTAPEAARFRDSFQLLN